nr:unnamed protein product [Callosobruchus chinensis]
MAEQALIQSVDDAELEKEIIAKFACPSCDKYIYPPIGQCRRGHAFCPRCFNRMNRCIFCLSTKSRTKCTVLEKINDLLQFPCRFANRGCTFTSKSSTIADHEVNCEHSVSVCPLRFNNCEWSGRRAQLVSHCLNTHPMNIYFTVTQQLLVQDFTDLRDRQFFMLFNVFDSWFRFNWALDSNTGTLLFSMYRLGTKPTQVKFGYEIKVTHPTRHGQRMVLRGSCHRLEDEGVVFMPDKHIYADYDMACAKADLDFEALEKDIVKKFVCPTCSRHIHPPIKQCMAGHIYCSICFDMLNKCWLCPAPKAEIRCCTLDKLHSLLNFPCKGYRKGCTFTGKLPVVDDHQKSCKYTAVSCPARGTDCSWVGNGPEIIPHLSEDHPANFSVSSEQDLKWNRHMERNRMHAHIFSAYGNLFRLTWMMDDKGTLRFGLFRMGGTRGRTRWSYRITVSHATESGCSISYIEPVRYLMDGGREEEWSDLWTNLDSWCCKKYCDDDGDLRYSVHINEIQ